jgi:ubiquinone/menaquinone biosynthesis C-methylase UbiE
MEHLKLLHVGCANRYYEGFINSDMRAEWKGKAHKLDLQMNLGEPWPYEDESVDGIVGMHVFQQLYWRNLLVAFREAYRVLKPGRALRMGCPMVEIEDRSLDYLLGWNNINLFSFDLLERVLRRIGFTQIKNCEYQETSIEEFKQIDNRKDRGTWYIEAIK